MSYKITCEPVKNGLGKKTGEFYAKLGDFGAYGPTKQDAIKSLTEGLEWYFDESDMFLTQVIQLKNSFFIMEKVFYGYCISTYSRESKYSTCTKYLDRMRSYSADIEFNKYVDRYLECTPEDSRLFN
jgi:hypothetical protein